MLEELSNDFREFLKEYKVLGLAVAFVMGGATTTLVKSLVENLFNPLLAVFIPESSLETATLPIGPVTFKHGAFLSDLISFIILALIVFLVAKQALKIAKK